MNTYIPDKSKYDAIIIGSGPITSEAISMVAFKICGNFLPGQPFNQTPTLPLIRGYSYAHRLPHQEVECTECAVISRHNRRCDDCEKERNKRILLISY